MSTPTRTTHEANCHCGSIRYTVTLSNAVSPEGHLKVVRCNCSICTKNGYLLVYPKREDVVFHDNSDSKLKDYFFGKKVKPHRFCPECSSSILIDFQNSDYERQRPFLAVNIALSAQEQARLFRNVDLANAVYDDFDGMTKLDPPYDK